MGLPVEVNNLMMGAVGGYQISRSLRFRSSASAYLTRTPSATGSTQKLTLSAWIKYSTSSTYSVLFSAQNTAGTDQDAIYIDSSTQGISMVFNGGSVNWVLTTQVFRDPSAWYHLVFAVDTTQATASNRVKLYVNGVQVTAFSQTGYPAQNYNFQGYNVSGRPQFIGTQAQSFPAYTWNGYIAEMNFIDGQALTPSSFGETDSITGVWNPKKYSGTYGTNGFYLNFSDNSGATATTIGKDSSGNGNNWTPNNISVTAGTTYDSMIDSPTPYADGNSGRGNYAVLNPLTIRGATGTLTNGNLSVAASSSSSPADTSMYATLALPSNGLIYLEALYTVTAGSGNETRIGVSTVGDTGSYVQAGSTTGYWSYDYKVGTANAQGTNTSYTAASTGQTVMFAIDVANGKIWAGANGTWYNTGNPASGTGAVVTSVSTSAIYLQTSLSGWVNRSSLDFNFGQRPFSYTPPSGFKALNTYNLPAASISNGAQYMAATTYTGNNSTNNISSGSNNTTGTTFQPDLVWLKCRSSAEANTLVDSVRGNNLILISSPTGTGTPTGTAAERTGSYNHGRNNIAISSTGVQITNSSGLDDETNLTGRSYIGWMWKGGGTAVTNNSGTISSQVSANTSSGISVVTWTGPTSGTSTVGHGLGVAPDLIITKSRNNVTNWTTYHSALGNTKYLMLNVTNAAATASTAWNNTSPTSSVFSCGTDFASSPAYTWVAYCFSAVRGFSAFGSYTGNGSSDGPFIYTGFRPRFVMLKTTGGTADHWVIRDTSRDTYNASTTSLYANLSNADDTPTNGQIDILSNGFKIRGTANQTNQSGIVYIYAAFAESPFNLSRAR